MSDFRESASIAARCPILREVLTSVGCDIFRAFRCCKSPSVPVEYMA